MGIVARWVLNTPWIRNTRMLVMTNRSMWATCAFQNPNPSR